MRIDIFTIFPGIFQSPLRESLLGRAANAGVLDIRVHDIRDERPTRITRWTTSRSAEGRAW